MIIYGKNPVKEVLCCQPDIVQQLLIASKKNSLFDTNTLETIKKRNINIREVSPKELGGITKSDIHQGVAARIAEFDYCDLNHIIKSDPGGLVLALDSLQDPHNLGALIRSAAAFGLTGVIIPKDRSVDITPVVVKASAGLCFRIPIAKVTNLSRALEDLFKNGFWIIGAAAGEGDPIDSIDLPGGKALVIGGEGAGLRRLVKEKCQKLAYIPMQKNIDSLNASVAGAVMMYSLSRKK